MSIPIRVLIVEDSEDDTILMVRELRKDGFDVVFERVDDLTAMENALVKQEWDIVISDYSMPKLDGIDALKLLEKKQVDLPFILVSGTIGEDIAVEAMKAGADDYIMKDNLTRLVSAVKRELKEFEARQKLKRMEEAIQALVKSTVVKTGQDAFRRIGSGIRDWLGTDYVCLGQILDKDKVKVLSMNVNGEFKCGCIYDLKGTLGDSVIKDGFCYYPEGAGKLLPEACEQCSKIKAEGYVGISIRDESDRNIGLLWTASRNKLDLPPRAREVMEIIAVKAASEIERMRAEEQLQKLSHAVEESSSVVLITDIKGAIEYVNPRFTKQTGYTLAEALGRTPSILKSGKTSRDEYKQLWEAITSGKEWHGEFCNKKKNGELYWESASISPVKNREGKITNFIAVKEDITERKRMEETIRRHNEELELLVEERTTRIMELERQRMENEKLAAAGQMAARVAHEINNPLSGIKGGFMLVKDAIDEKHKYYQYVGLIEKEVDRIARIVKQMFDLNRPYQGKISEFDSMVPIRDVINMLRNLGNEHDVSLDLNACSNTVKTTMSEDYFRQILYNIIKNAIEASPEGGKVNVNVRNHDGRLKVIVSDQGGGISDELRSKIFEPFFTTKDKYSGSGMGLGLSTTKVITESMGGTLDFSSKEGKGTAFTIDLPINLIKQKNTTL
ncbi:MAG: ATP-binding protein [Candidatus Scalindua sp.]